MVTMHLVDVVKMIIEDHVLVVYRAVVILRVVVGEVVTVTHEVAVAYVTKVVVHVSAYASDLQNY